MSLLYLHNQEPMNEMTPKHQGYVTLCDIQPELRQTMPFFGMIHLQTRGIHRSHGEEHRFSSLSLCDEYAATFVFHDIVPTPVRPTTAQTSSESLQDRVSVRDRDYPH